MSAFRFVRGFSSFHSGIDLAASRGTPVHAVAGGPVKYAGSADAPGAPGNTRGAGNVVVIAVGPLEHHYAHLDTIRASGSVYDGGLIGGVGMTGNATGYHLHFGIWDTRLRRYVDPTTYITVANLIRAVSGVGLPAAGNAIPVSTTTPLPSATLPVPYGKYFRTVRNPPVSPTFTVVAGLNADWAQWLIESYPQVRDYFPVFSELFGANKPTIDEFNAQVKAKAIAVASAYIGQPVSATPDTLAVDLPTQSNWVTDLVGGLYGALARLGQAAALAALALLGVYLLAKGR